MAKKHAYLVMAHKCDYTLQTLIEMLDYPLNDIFIHMDAKNKEFSKESLPRCLYSKVHITQRIKVAWGGASMINAELLLLKTACKEERYEYYHLISGEDLPLKANDYIHSFFEEHKGKEFVHFQSYIFPNPERIKYYFFFQEWAGNKNNFWHYADRALIELQKILHINRNDKMIFRKGSQWFSITDELARFIIANEKLINNTFKHTKCCDEVFIQTIIEQSDFFKKNLFHKEYDDDYHTIMRLIDWKRGSPYIFRESDYNELITSKMLWARKFNSDIDKIIITKIKEYLKEKGT
ncbi:MAG: beta-1,6-N-acetylglucosaminyltransferase [Succiniclasticum sp.]|uniref:beta-1,6-N-acetylglucosaminyltransferase n=1 Tax=Succiniclasticum sp. TaxID=2775030 RepID=UPI002A9177ED|nr:beta-1,6-N-acetylglucosaminyltransferase [Succiniclasticum sp.]MDY6291083.1 beta-1,6-N-acetylglucosaminyltransferase [Succiniclasticum sp.]